MQGEKERNFLPLQLQGAINFIKSVKNGNWKTIISRSLLEIPKREHQEARGVIRKAFDGID
jgi:hypothetical protein